jgi:hypothetical protein
MKSRVCFWLLTSAVLLGASLPAATPGFAQVPIPITAERDNMTCYNIQDSQVQQRPRAELENVFGTRTCTIERQARWACTPSAKLVGDANDQKGGPAGKFLCYDVTKCKGDRAPRRIDVADQYWEQPSNPEGWRNIEIEHPRFLCVPAEWEEAAD